MTKRERCLVATAEALWAWAEEEDLTANMIAGELGIVPNRACAALLVRDWEPTLRHLAKIEAKSGMSILELSGNK